MAKFFVGQRVRIIRVNLACNAHFVGMEGRISEVREDFLWGEAGYGLDIAPVTSIYTGNGHSKVAAWRSTQLAPVLPDGHQPCGESYEQLMGRLRSGVIA